MNPYPLLPPSLQPSFPPRCRRTKAAEGQGRTRQRSAQTPVSIRHHIKLAHFRRPSENVLNLQLAEKHSRERTRDIQRGPLQWKRISFPSFVFATWTCTAGVRECTHFIRRQQQKQKWFDGVESAYAT